MAGPITENRKIVMECRDLRRCPHYDLPDGVSFRFFKGDEDRLVWTELYSSCELFNKITDETHLREFGSDLDVIADRQLFMNDGEGKEIGTVTAWFDDDFHGEPYGRIHWVGIVPDYQGRGLSKPMMSRTCELLLELGHEKAYLVTSSARVPAINLYKKFGFAETSS